MKYTKSLDDFMDELNVHVKQIIKCCHEFDDGERESMLHVTTSLRTLLKNKPPRTISLLHHLGRSDIEFVDIAGIGKPVSLAPMFSGGLSINDYVPRLNTENRKWVKFDDWYKGLVLYAKDNYNFTRESLIADFGEKYTQHSDKKVPKDLHSLYKNIDDYVGWRMVSGGIKIKQPNIIYSVLRMICHEVIVSFHKHELTNLKIDEIYFNKLVEINPYTPFGNYNVSLLNKSTITIEFYCTKNNKLWKLPISGEYYLSNHKENVPDFKKYINSLVDDIISSSVYKYLDTIKNGLSHSNDFHIREFIELNEEMFAAVHKPTKKYQVAEKILIDFKFSIQIDKRI